MSEQKKGVFLAIGAYLMWGIIPLYWKQLQHVGSVEILVGRVIWSFVFTVLFVLLIRQYKQMIVDIKMLWKNKKQFILLFVASVFVSLNWGIFIWAVNNGHLLQTSLGYYINPLISVLFGMIFFKEKISRATAVAVIIAATGVGYQAILGGTIPWVSLSLALTFAFYGVIKKQIPLDATRGLAIETLFVLPIAVSIYIYLMNTSEIAFMHVDWKTNLLLMGGGIVTALPLVLFAKSAQKIPLYLMGFIQFLAPTISLMLGIFLYKEPFTLTEFITFLCIWLAVFIFSASKVLEARKNHTTYNKEHEVKV
ncbi:transporter [Solibacillus silvestris]|nr:EamA family transporter RarD [Solibacillus silvestris]OBW60328.1 transporter [Solibacillus silvestris]